MRFRVIYSGLLTAALFAVLVSVAASPVNKNRPSSSRRPPPSPESLRMLAPKPNPSGGQSAQVMGGGRSQPPKDGSASAGPPLNLALLLFNEAGSEYVLLTKDGSKVAKKRTLVGFGVGKDMRAYDKDHDTIISVRTHFTMSNANPYNDVFIEILDVSTAKKSFYSSKEGIDKDLMDKSRLQAKTGCPITDDESYVRASFMRFKPLLPLPQYLRVLNGLNERMERLKSSKRPWIMNPSMSMDVSVENASTSERPPEAPVEPVPGSVDSLTVSQRLKEERRPQGSGHPNPTSGTQMLTNESGPSRQVQSAPESDAAMNPTSSTGTSMPGDPLRQE
ncbi:hypothetical protein EV360DRAFT_74362 [Lentinula raphanica]|nr:hypothetical protein EV360DRAFT_74362 [Lentinula raphanica]